jgi:cell division protein FtsL
MMRGLTLFWLLAAALIVTAVFGIAYQTEERERELTRLRREILAEQDAIHVLTAEWAYLTQPARIQALAQRHLHLVPVDASRMIKLEDLPARLAGDQKAAPPAPVANPPASAAKDAPSVTYTRAATRGQTVR